jgi:hypothetical protein
MITAVIVAALLQSAAINNQRNNFMDCLDKGVATAKTQKMPAAAIEAFLRQSCSPIEETFKASLIGFDLKNKVPRKQAASDAQVQVNDFVSELVERYKLMTTPK